MNEQIPNSGEINLHLIDSLNHPLAGPIRQLLTRAGRAELNKILIDDEENILQALACGIAIESVYFAGETTMPESVKSRLAPGVTVHEVAKRTAKKIFENDRASRLFAIAQTPTPLPLDALDRIERDVVVLDDLSISGNIGNIVRTALAMDAGAVVLLHMDPLDIYDRRLIRASRGYVFALPVIATAAEAFVDYCAARGAKLAVTSAAAQRTVDTLAAEEGRLMIVFGAEKTGASARLQALAALRIAIPINPTVESLNVAAAAGIILHSRARYNRAKAGR